MQEINFCILQRKEYGWLSNFHKSPFKAGNKVWDTVEHFYQAMKTISKTEREWVRTAPTPKEAKRRGKKVTLRQDWEKIKIEVMRFALIRKFKQNKELYKRLLKTGNAKLIEDSYWDSFWGIGGNRKGENILGKLLMDLRLQFLMQLT